jgi:hypothetical protein
MDQTDTPDRTLSRSRAGTSIEAGVEMIPVRAGLRKFA